MGKVQEALHLQLGTVNRLSPLPPSCSAVCCWTSSSQEDRADVHQLSSRCEMAFGCLHLSVGILNFHFHFIIFYIYI